VQNTHDCPEEFQTSHKLGPSMSMTYIKVTSIGQAPVGFKTPGGEEEEEGNTIT